MGMRKYTPRQVASILTGLVANGDIPFSSDFVVAPLALLAPEKREDLRKPVLEVDAAWQADMTARKNQRRAAWEKEVELRASKHKRTKKGPCKRAPKCSQTLALAVEGTIAAENRNDCHLPLISRPKRRLTHKSSEYVIPVAKRRITHKSPGK